MKKSIQIAVISVVALLGVASTVLPAQPTAAINVFNGSCGGGANGATPAPAPAQGANGGGGSSQDVLCGATSQDTVGGLTQNVITTLFVILGSIAVIMIVIGGIRYTTSNGDASQTKAAKDTILYAVIGLVVAIMAYAIVSFTLTQFA